MIHLIDLAILIDQHEIKAMALRENSNWGIIAPETITVPNLHLII